MHWALELKKLFFQLSPSLAIRLSMVGSGERAQELQIVKALVPSDRAAVDIGASWGLYTQLFRTCTKSVVAFEANPEKAAYLRRVFGRTVIVHSIALSDQSGDTELVIPNSSSALATIESANPLSRLGPKEAARIRVPMRKLDDVQLDKVGFIKIDVEGHELSVISGGRSLLLRDRPVLFVEIERRRNSLTFEQVFSILRDVGYRGFFHAGIRISDIRHFDAERDQGSQHLAETSGLKDYVFNFLFIPKGDNTPLMALRSAGFTVID